MGASSSKSSVNDIGNDIIVRNGQSFEEGGMPKFQLLYTLVVAVKLGLLSN